MIAFPRYIILWVLACLVLSCESDPCNDATVYELDLPAGFPEMPVPEGNELTQARITLGKQLFYDKRLSRDGQIACASCHLQELAFTDGEAVSIGAQGRTGFRNAPSLANVGYHPYLFREGGGISLETQVLGPLEDSTEMAFNMLEAVNRLKEFPEYQAQAEQAYDQEFSAFVLTRALGAFQRTLISGESAYDQYLYAGAVLDSAAIRGAILFNGDKAQCSSCHSGFNYTDYSFQNIGLYDEYSDLGRARVSLDLADIGKFKVPSLRNVALTAPYMHDGSIQRLEQIIEHYDHGGQGHINQNPAIVPLGLSTDEKADLLAFLESLSDLNFISKPEFGPE